MFIKTYNKEYLLKYRFIMSENNKELIKEIKELKKEIEELKKRRISISNDIIDKWFKRLLGFRIAGIIGYLIAKELEEDENSKKNKKKQDIIIWEINNALIIKI